MTTGLTQEDILLLALMFKPNENNCYSEINACKLIVRTRTLLEKLNFHYEWQTVVHKENSYDNNIMKNSYKLIPLCVKTICFEKWLKNNKVDMLQFIVLSMLIELHNKWFYYVALEKELFIYRNN